MIPGPQNVSPRHFLARSIHDLIDSRTKQAHFSRICAHDQISLIIEVHATGSLHFKLNLSGIGAGSQDEVGFNLPLVSVISQIDARINIPVTHLGKIGDVRAPLLWIVSDEVICFTLQLLKPLNLRGGASAQHLQPEEGSLARCICATGGAKTASRFQGAIQAARVLPQGQHSFVRRKKQVVPSASGNEIHTAVGLANVFFKCQRKS